MKIDREYPREVRIDGRNVRLGLMSSDDRAKLQALARVVPEHDLLFMHRDITSPRVLDAWLDDLERGDLATVLAEENGAVLGYATIEPEREPWSRHVAELRVLVAPSVRGSGIGRLLTQEAFAVALSAGIEKITARMTPDQKAAVRTFQGLGFKPEGLFQEHVKDRDGVCYDLLVLSHDVAGFHAMLEAYGVAESLGE